MVYSAHKVACEHKHSLCLSHCLATFNIYLYSNFLTFGHNCNFSSAGSKSTHYTVTVNINNILVFRIEKRIWSCIAVFPVYLGNLACCHTKDLLSFKLHGNRCKRYFGRSFTFALLTVFIVKGTHCYKVLFAVEKAKHLLFILL